MTATDELRRMLDEFERELCHAGCGVECETYAERKKLLDDVKDRYVQAIEVTLGRTCEVVYVVEIYDDLTEGFGLTRECYAKKEDAIRRCEALTYEEDGIRYWARWTELKVTQ